MAQVRFSTSVSPSTIGRDEMAQLKLTVENAGEVQRIDPPSLKNGFDRQRPQPGKRYEHGERAGEPLYRVNLSSGPNQPAVYHFRPQAKADGAEYKSNAVTVK